MKTNHSQPRSLREGVKSKVDQQLQRNAARKIVGAVHSWRLGWEKASRRWVWELLQNAIDTAVRCRRGLCAKFELRQDALICEHDGGPFLDEEIGALLLAGSAKPFENSPFVGRFGSGFLVTHAISPHVIVSGQAEGYPGGFKLILDRSGREDDIHTNIEACYQALDRSEAVSVHGARFEYIRLNQRGLDVGRRGLVLLDKLAPYIFAFNDCLKAVEIGDGRRAARWERGIEETVAARESKVRKIHLSRFGDAEDKYIVHVGSPSESGRAAAVLKVCDSGAEFVEIGKTLPKVYRNIPLLESEEAGIPIAIDCPFDINEERSAAFLFSGSSVEEPADDSGPGTHNQELAADTLSGLADFLAYLSRLDASGAHKAVRIEPAPSPSGDSAWNSALKILGNRLLSLPVVKSATEPSAYVDPNSVVFLNPVVSEDLSHIAVEGEKLWSLISDFDICLPPKESSVDWGKTVAGWLMLGVDVPKIWTLEDVLGHARKASSLEDLAGSIGADETDALSWLLAVLDLLTPHASELPTGMLDGLLPDQNGHLKKPKQLAVDLGVDEGLKEIAEDAGRSLRDRLLEKRLTETVSSKETRHLISQYVTDQLDSNAAVRQLVDEMRDRLLDLDRAGPGTLAEDTDPIIQHSAKLLAWLSAHRPDYNASVRDLPLVTASGDLIVSPAGPSCYLPLEAWPDRARPFVGVFPESSRLASFYATAVDEPHENLAEALVDWKVCFSDLVVAEETIELKGSLVEKLLRDRAQSVDARSTYSCQRCSQIPLLHEVIGRIGTDCGRATAFLQFLISYVIREDSLWRATGEATNRAGKLPIRPSEWLGRILRDNWVPNPDATEGTADRIPATQESLRGLVPWTEIDSDELSSEFLGLLGFDELEMWIQSHSGGDKDQENRLRSDLAKLAQASGAFGLPEALRFLDEKLERSNTADRNRKYGLLVQGIVKKLIEETYGKEVEVIDCGYDLLVYERGEADLESDWGQFRAGAYLVEIKAARTNDVRLTAKQAQTAADNDPQYILCVVDLRSSEAIEPSMDEVERKIRITTRIGGRLQPLVARVDEAAHSDPEVPVDRTGQLRYCVTETLWVKGEPLQTWIASAFAAGHDSSNRT